MNIAERIYRFWLRHAWGPYSEEEWTKTRENKKLFEFYREKRKGKA